MIKIVALMKVKPACIAEFQARAKELVEKSRAEEGNVSYSLNELTGDPSTMAFIEIWKDQAAIDAHNATDHFTRILPGLAELCESAQPVNLFTEVEFH
ncbi:MAG: antibiotic biosynthesis monooxygenase [Oscillospiraceae bacterium]|nr:antibiotic biosynthesis monooxygenase [Oscillospiraceae bacterium]